MLEFNVDDLDMDAVAAAVEQAMNTSQEKLDKLMERCRKALARAEDTTAGDEATREAAKNIAARLMSEYGITAAMLADSGKVQAKVGDHSFEVSAPYTYDKAGLLGNVAQAYGGQAVYTTRTTERSVLRVFGMDSDLARIKLLWPSLMTQLTNEMAAAAARRTGKERRDVFERWFIAKFSDEVATRIEAAEAKATNDAEQERVADPVEAGTGKSVALVLAGRKGQVEAAYKAAYPKVRKGRARKLTYSAEGAAAGRAAGQRADLGGNSKLGSTGGRAALR